MSYITQYMQKDMEEFRKDLTKSLEFKRAVWHSMNLS